eukprot:33295_1
MSTVALYVNSPSVMFGVLSVIQIPFVRISIYSLFKALILSLILSISFLIWITIQLNVNETIYFHLCIISWIFSVAIPMILVLHGFQAMYCDDVSYYQPLWQLEAYCCSIVEPDKNLNTLIQATTLSIRNKQNMEYSYYYSYYYYKDVDYTDNLIQKKLNDAESVFTQTQRVLI